MSAARAIALALAVFALAAAWLRLAPAPIGLAIAGWSGAVGEAGFTIAVFVPLALLALVAGRLAGVAPLALGADPRRGVARGAAIGAGGFALALGYTALAGTVTRGGPGGPGAAVLLGAAVILFQVAAEEWLFRGLLQPLVARAIGAAAIPVVALAFGALHAVAGAPGPLALANLALGGLVFGAIAWHARGVAGAIGAHGAWNLAEQIGVGLDPNPGVGGFGSIVDLDLVGRADWGGSPDGLNASWAMGLALAAMLALVVGRYVPATRPASIRSRHA